MALLIDLVVFGTAIGAAYALLAVGFATIYTVSRILHFAHAAVFTLAAWSFFIIGQQLHRLGLSLWPALSLSALLTVVFAVLAGVLIYLVVYKQLARRQASTLMYFVASLGVVWVVENAIQLASQGDVEYVLQGRNAVAVWSLAGVHLTAVQIGSVVGAAACLIAFGAFLRYTKYGLAIRAVSDSPVLARVVGVRTEQARIAAFAVGSALAVPPAVIFALNGGVTAYFGSALVFRGIAATIIGGVGSIPGAILAGVLIGLAETVPLVKIPTGWQTSLAFGLLLLVLLVRPSGLFGRKVASMGL